MSWNNRESNYSWTNASCHHLICLHKPAWMHTSIFYFIFYRFSYILTASTYIRSPKAVWIYEPCLNLQNGRKSSLILPIHTSPSTTGAACFSLSSTKGRLSVQTHNSTLHEKSQHDKAWHISTVMCKLLCDKRTVHWGQWRYWHGYMPVCGRRWHDKRIGMVWFARAQLLVFRETMPKGMESLCFKFSINVICN